MTTPIMDLEDELARVKSQRDALLVALKQALPMLAQYVKLTTEGASTYVVARAAIRQAEGEVS